jgi:hypothetical protein
MLNTCCSTERIVDRKQRSSVLDIIIIKQLRHWTSPKANLADAIVYQVDTKLYIIPVRYMMVSWFKCLEASSSMHYHMKTSALICLIRRHCETFSRDSVCISCHQKLSHFATVTFVSENRQFSKNTFIFYKYQLSTNCNNSSLSNKYRSYLHIITCCGLEFQFLSVSTHSRLPSRSTRSGSYDPNPLSPYGYNRAHNK